MRLEKSVFFFKRYLDLLEKIKEINSPHAYLLFRYIMKRIAKCDQKQHTWKISYLNVKDKMLIL